MRKTEIKVKGTAKEIADLVLTLQNRQSVEKTVEVKLYPEKISFHDRLKAVLEATDDTCGEQAKKTVHNAE